MAPVKKKHLRSVNLFISDTYEVGPEMCSLPVESNAI